MIAHFGGKALADTGSRYGRYAGVVVAVAVVIAVGSKMIARR